VQVTDHNLTLADFAPSIANDHIAWTEVAGGPGNPGNIYYWNGIGTAGSPITADAIGHSNASISVNQANGLEQIAWQNGDGSLSLGTIQLRTALTGTISVGNAIGPVTLNGNMSGAIFAYVFGNVLISNDFTGAITAVGGAPGAGFGNILAVLGTISGTVTPNGTTPAGPFPMTNVGAIWAFDIIQKTTI